MDYFEYSQSVKGEVEATPEILVNARRAFAGEVETFGFGSTVELYRLGKTASGLWTALRAYRNDAYGGNMDREQQARHMEYYCQNAEELAARGEGVPVFCIGVTCGNRAGIITEDLTANSQNRFEHNPENAYGFVIQGDKRRKVFVDIDGVFRYKSGLEAKYFSEENALVL